jgi:hypothetical protein
MADSILAPRGRGNYILEAFLRKLQHRAQVFLDDRNENAPVTRATLRFYPGTTDFKLAKPIEVVLASISQESR